MGMLLLPSNIYTIVATNSKFMINENKMNFYRKPILHLLRFLDTKDKVSAYIVHELTGLDMGIIRKE